MPLIGVKAPSATRGPIGSDAVECTEPHREPRGRHRRRSAPMLLLCSAILAQPLVAGPVAAAPAPVPPAPIRPAPVPPLPLDDPYALLAGRTYTSVTVIGGTIPGGGPVVIGFDNAHRVGMDAGCNSHAGSVAVTGDRLRIGRLASTMMACPPPRADADEWLARFTSVPLVWRVIGPILTLSSPVHTVILLEDR
ncbi:MULTISPECIES: META domain-containing protein [Gordonia]|uniref:META domain-containing protein n=2 Tax=Gordonia TaxID=2053 RepID=A0A9X3I4K7_9ACTN|nr:MULTISPECIES: META domain-containing protein [Gordonia]MCF3939508.1 META domain-containing protein [Gordonia tangerina]MCX2964316.1 META domain-containing protein [Gordonia aquimaris]